MSCSFQQALPLPRAPGWLWDADLGCVGCRPRLCEMQTSACCPEPGALDPAPPVLALHRAVESQALRTAMGSEVTAGLSAVAGFSIWP